MRNDRDPCARDSRREAALIRHPSASPREVLLGTATDGVDLSAYVTQLRETGTEASARLAWHHELYGADQPRPGEVLEIRMEGVPHWIGVIEAVNDYRERRGERALSVTARSRDQSPLWRDVRRVSDIYPVGTALDVIARDIAAGVGLATDEIAIPPIGIRTVHSGVQLADLSAWEMLDAVLLPAGLSPWVDALGVLKAVSRETTREPDITLTPDRVLAVTGARSRPAATAVRLKWLDPNLTKVSQQGQVLATATLTAGFFKLTQEQDVYFSDDRTQRAENTYLVVKQSVNSGLVPVGTEEYRQLSPRHGRITITTHWWVPGLAGASLAAIAAASRLPDIAPPGGGETIPTGKIVQGAATIAVLLVMMSLGTGVYEIWGTPYDYVHARNTTEAYDSAAPAWADTIAEIENDLVPDEETAQGLAVRELLHAVRSATSYGVEIVDDPRIEVGDILSLPDGSRLYVTGWTRDLTRGAPAILTVSGFKT